MSWLVVLWKSVCCFWYARQSFGTPSFWPPKRKTAGICKNVQRSAFRHRSAKPCFLLTHAPKFACASSRRVRRALKKFRLGLALMWLSNARFCSPFKSRPGQLFHKKNWDISSSTSTFDDQKSRPADLERIYREMADYRWNVSRHWKQK